MLEILNVEEPKRYGEFYIKLQKGQYFSCPECEKSGCYMMSDGWGSWEMECDVCSGAGWATPVQLVEALNEGFLTK